MYPPNDNTASSRSVLIRFLVRSREYRNPHLWVRVRVACGVFNVVLAVLLLTSGHWLGPLAWLGVLPLAGAALIFWTAYRLQTSVQT
ncbi:MAG TPA: hypothetical protein VII22_25210 [Streptosporangiaceae bacterium]